MENGRPFLTLVETSATIRGLKTLERFKLYKSESH